LQKSFGTVYCSSIDWIVRGLTRIMKAHDTTYLKPLAAGILSYVPGANRFLNRVIYRRYLDPGDPQKIARYHYGDWLRHLVTAHRNGVFDERLPRVVAELGPGNSLGTGICALLSGAEEYYAFDVVPYNNIKTDVAVLDELVRLFKTRADIPDHAECRILGFGLDSYSFPSYVLTPDRLDVAICDDRVALIREQLLSLHTTSRSKQMISYFAPYDGLDVVRPASVDMVVGRNILEHVEDLGNMYKQISRWLRTGGLVSLTGDFSSHGFAKQWNGHWAYSDFLWKLMRGKHPWFINREPYSSQVKCLSKHGFRIIYEVAGGGTAGSIARESLSGRFRALSEADLFIRVAFVQAVKK
jgi:hypothetical protein